MKHVIPYKKLMAICKRQSAYVAYLETFARQNRVLYNKFKSDTEKLYDKTNS